MLKSAVHQTEYRDTPPALSPVSRRDYRRYGLPTTVRYVNVLSTAGLHGYKCGKHVKRVRAPSGYRLLQFAVPPRILPLPKAKRTNYVLHHGAGSRMAQRRYLHALRRGHPVGAPQCTETLNRKSRYGA